MKSRVGILLAGACLALAPLAAYPDPAGQGRVGEVPQAAAGPDEGPLVAPGEAPDLALLYTGSVVGYVEPCG